VRLAETLLDRKARVCGTITRGIPPDVEQESTHWKQGQSGFQKNSDIIVQVWKDKRPVPMISTIHDTIVNAGGKDKKTNLEIKKRYTVVQYNKLMKPIDRAVQYLSYYSVLRKTLKWWKASAKTVQSSMHFCVQNTKHKQKQKYKNFLRQVTRSWTSEGQNLSPLLTNCSIQHQGA
jgi:hypothetical protein